MKSLYCFIVAAVLLVSCGAPSAEEGSYPEDLEGKRALLKEKKLEMRALSKMVAQLEEEIGILDPASNEKVPVVTTVQVQRKDFAHFTEVQGAVEAEDLVAISSETGGRIIDLRIKEGQSIRKGQLVAKLDLESVEKQIAELDIQLDLAKDLYERQKRLWDQEIGSEVQYLQAKNNKERLEKALETIQLQLEKAEVYAPASGVIETLNLKAGEIAAPGAPIAMILNTDRVKIVADIPETLIRSVSKGAFVEASIPSIDWEKEVRITDLGRTINPVNRTLKVEAVVVNNGMIRPNLLSIMLIKDYEEKNVVIIPRELVQQEVGGRDFVYIKDSSKDGTIAKKIYIKTGKSYESEVIITEGLQGGEELIVKGSRSLAANDLIKIQG